jgi:hypothetical protein
MLGGVAVFDYDGDGYLDIYFVNGAGMPSLVKQGPQYKNRLYRNNHNLTFTDVTDKAGVGGAGYGMGVAVGDYDNDGWPDLYRGECQRESVVPQQREWHVHRCDEEGRRGGRLLRRQEDVVGSRRMAGL